MTIGEMDVKSNSNNNMNLADITDIFPVICQRIVKKISIEKLTFNDRSVESISYSLDNILNIRGLKFTMNNEDYEAQLKIQNSTMFLNVTSGTTALDIGLIYGILDKHVSLKVKYKSNEVFFDGIYTGNAVNGLLHLPMIFNQKLSCSLSLDNGIVEASVYSKDTGISSHLIFNIKEESLLVKDTSINSDIKIEPFFIHNNLPIPNIKILPKQGTINIKNLNLFSKEVKLDKIEIKDISITEIPGLEALDGGKLNGTGTYENNTVKLDLKITDCQIGQIKVPVLDVVAQCKKDNSKIQMKYNLLKKQSLIECQISADNWLPSKNSRIKLKAAGELRIQDYVLAGNQSATGRLKYDFCIDGTVINPIFSGGIKLKDGIYMNPSTNTYIKNCTISASIKNNNLVIDKIYATDDGRPSGTIAGSGKISLKQSNLDTDITIDLHNFNIVEINEFYGKVNGRINIKGDLLKSIRITGDMYSDQAKLDISNLVMKTSRSIEIVKVEEPHKPSTIRPHQIKVPIDIKFIFKNGIKIKGAGVDSMWDGGASLHGDIFDPKYEAKITMKKGSIRVSGKEFNLKDGVIWINSTQSDTFHISVTAVKKLDNIKVGARFTQDEKGTNVEFFSKPYASRIDILSYLLFDKRSAEISAGEAFTLFSIMSKITEGDKPDILDKLKSVLGLDAIEIKKNTDANRDEYSAVSIGKRIGSVKISIDQGAGKDTTKVVLEKKIAKNAKISVDLSGKNSMGAGIFWSKRY
jgi:hypothetical protein